MCESGRILYADLAHGLTRLGGSSLAHVFGQLGYDPPDLSDPPQFKRAFEVVQRLIGEGQLTAGHDRSDGGLITTLLEMAFAGNCGLEIDLPGDAADAMPILFNEELGLVMEVPPQPLP